LHILQVPFDILLQKLARFLGIIPTATKVYAEKAVFRTAKHRNFLKGLPKVPFFSVKISIFFS